MRARTSPTTLLNLHRRMTSTTPPSSLTPTAHAIRDTRRRSTLSVPTGAWDSHMHVCDVSRFPPAASASYKPHDALLVDALANAERLQLPNLVLVQPSTYGNDNACLLDAFATLGPERARGVVAFDPSSTQDDTLEKWHELGVRGVRINLKSGGGTASSEDLERKVRKYHEALKGFPTWIIELYMDLALIPALERLMDRLDGRKVVVAHLGAPPEVRKDMDGTKGWSELLRLVRKDKHFFVKVSGPYRFVEKGKGYEGLEGIVRDLLEASSVERGGGGLVFASDWPHTRYEGVDVEPWVGKCLAWCDGDQDLAERLFRDNAEELWDVGMGAPFDVKEKRS